MVDVSLLYLLPALSHTASFLCSPLASCAALGLKLLRLLQCLLGTHYQSFSHGLSAAAGACYLSKAPVCWSVNVTQSEMLARGDSGLLLGLKLSVSGSVSGSSDSGTACGSYKKHRQALQLSP